MILEPITDNEIKVAEKALLPEGIKFDEERITIIKELNSVDVQACPGSGKTTVLLAKLIIMANRMPLPGNKGICVLTHTNVAIDEIKKELYSVGSKLFSYPNHFSTIQSFVDKFLAIPASIHYFNKRPDSIDAEFYEKRLDNIYNVLPWNHPIKNWFYQRFRSRKLSNDELKKVSIDLFKRFRVDFINERIVDDISTIDPPVKLSFNSNTGKEIYNIKTRLFEQGVLHYEDAYCLAAKYLHDYSGLTTNSFSSRFGYVLIDEMQDTDTHQINLINKLFDSTKVKIQRIGDKNQAIYNNVKAEQIWKINKDNFLPITGSKRFHNRIANTVKTICIEENNQLQGNDDVEPAISPAIIVFDDNSIEKVIVRYCELIISNNLHTISKKEFKAIGWRKEHDDGLAIKSYWNEYSTIVKSRRKDFDSLKGYLYPLTDSEINKLGVKHYKDSIINSILKSLKITDNKSSKNEKSYLYNKSSLLIALKSVNREFYKRMNLKISAWAMKIHNGEDIKNEVANFIKDSLFELPIFEIKNEEELDKFLNSDMEELNEEEASQSSNVYKYEYKEGEFINVHVGTIHSAKGETHCATLYLESKYYADYESKRLMEFFKGNYNQEEANKQRHKESLKMAYVGMTRPSHFLCLAIHSDRLTDKDEEELINAGWEIDKHLV